MVIENLERAYDVQRHTTTKAQRPEEKQNKKVQCATRADKSGRETKQRLVFNGYLCGQRLFETWLNNRCQDVCFREIQFQPCVSSDSNARENGVALTVGNGLSTPIMARGVTAVFLAKNSVNGGVEPAKK